VYAENRPNGIVYTASGAVAKANHTIAVDTSVIPFGTTVIINGNEYVAEDTGSAINGNRIDIYFDNHEDALDWGRQTIEIEVIV
jgi:3D (Asp-Asp-Asp) domain-containing protein